MKEVKNSNKELLIDNSKLKHLIVEERSEDFKVSLIDGQGYKIVCGYGMTIVEALNDMHGNIIWLKNL